MTKRFKIGRNLGQGPLVPSFDLVREDDGRILIQSPDAGHGPTEAEQTQVMRVLTKPLRAFGGNPTDERGAQVDTFVEMQPGTSEHFLYAVHALPLPFGPLPVRDAR